MGYKYLALLLISFNCHAFEIIELDKFDITYRNYFPGGRVPLVSNVGIPYNEPANYLALGMNMNILDTIRWDNIVDSYTDHNTATGAAQFRTVSWEFSVYIQPFQWLDVGYYHHSQHVLDTYNALGYPVEDALFLRLNVFKSPHRREPIF